jgi:hypothetical protein
MSSMKTVEFCCWLIPTKMVKTRYCMDEATALEAQPAAVKVRGKLEMRNIPETAQSRFGGSRRSSWSSTSPK